MSTASTAAPLILVVEDEPTLASLVADYLHAAGYRSEIIGDGLAVLDAVRARQPALVLLDLMLPGRGGLDLCRELRGFSAVPVIMMTARIEEADRLRGLEIGADDYLCKPYSPRELVARVKAVLRRPPLPSPPPDGLRFDAEALRASLGGQLLDLTPAEFRLLRTLAATPGRVFTRDQLLDGMHDDGRALTDRAVDSHVRNLRRKLAAVRPDGDAIRSVYGVGYAWEPPP